jgi:hypothetical protein
MTKLQSPCAALPMPMLKHIFSKHALAHWIQFAATTANAYPNRFPSVRYHARKAVDFGLVDAVREHVAFVR